MTKKSKEGKVKKKRRSKPTQLSSFAGSKKHRHSKPDRQQLKAIYKQMIIALPEARVNQLIAAVHWYDSALDYARDIEKKNEKLKLVPKLKLLESIQEIRDLSLKTTNIEKKEALLKKLIEKFEQVLSGIIRTKSIASAYEKLSKSRSRLEKRLKRLETKYQTVIGLIEDALQPKNALGFPVQLKVVDLEKERAVSHDLRSFLYSKNYAQQILNRFKSEGALPVVVSELDYLSRACGHKPNPDEKGKFIVDLHKERESIFTMLKNLIDYCKSDKVFARKLVKAKRKKRRSK